MIDLSIIIVNWNTRDVLLNCLNSISEHLTKLTYEIIVVDNGSSDGSQEAVKLHHPKTILVTNQKNTGFARAANQGLRVAQGRYYLLLNSDTIITPGALEEMVQIVDAMPRLGILAPQLMNQDGSYQNSFDNFPDLTAIFFNKSLLRLLFPVKYPSKRQSRSVPFDVESVIGACMMIRPEAINQVGLLDEDYFLFLEETDLCYRMSQKDWRVRIAPNVKIFHLQGETKKRFLVPSQIEYFNSFYKFFRKHKSALVYLLIRVLLPFKIIIELFFNVIGCLLTIGLLKGLRQKCYIYSNLLFWHLRGCPKEMTLHSLSKAISKKTVNIPIHWRYRDIYLDKDALPTHLTPDFVLLGRGLGYEALKAHRLKRLFRLKPFGSQEQYLMKLYQDGHPFSWLKSLFEGPKASREFKIARKLAYEGIPTVVPLAIGYNKLQEDFPRHHILISHELKNSCGLDKYLLRNKHAFFLPNERLLKETTAASLPYNLKLRQEVIIAYGTLAAKIHQKGIIQDDFGLNNMLIQFALPQDKSATEFKLYLIDFERVKIYRNLTFRQRVHNLAGLNRIREPNISRTDRIRFLKGYLNTNNKAILAAWLKMISDAGMRILFKDYRRAARVSCRESRSIGKCRFGSIRGFYRRFYPILNKAGFCIPEMEKLIHEIMIYDEQGDIKALSFKKMDNTETTLIPRFFRSYHQAKCIWRSLNAFMRTYTAPVLPVALLKTQWRGKKGIVIFEPVSAGRINPCFSAPEKIEERLTRLREIVI